MIVEFRSFFENRGFKVWDPDHIWNNSRFYLYRSNKVYLLSRFKNRIIFIISLLCKTPPVLWYCNQHRRFVFGVFRMILESSISIKIRVLLFKYFLIDLFQYSVVQNHAARENEIVLIDEGFNQHAFTFLVQKGQPINYRRLSWYCTFVPLPDLMIYLHVEPEACFDRMDKRGLPHRLKEEPTEVVREILEKWQEFFPVVENLIQQRKSCATMIVQFDGNDLKNATENLIKHLTIYF